MIKKLAFCLFALPLVWLVWGGFTQHLGANPVEYVIRDLGDWALRFLALGLCASPVQKMFGWTVLMRLRRMIGLYAFFYALLHLLVFWGVDLELSGAALLHEVLKRNFILVGMAALLLMLPLALTSTSGMVKRLGAARWKKLHKLVYSIALLAVLHFYWMVKADKTEPLIYAAIIGGLLLYRVIDGWFPKARLLTRLFTRG